MSISSSPKPIVIFAPMFLGFLLIMDNFITLRNMETLTIDKKTFVVIEQKEFDKLQLMAAQKTTPAKKLSLAAGKKHAYKLIDQWAKGK